MVHMRDATSYDLARDLLAAATAMLVLARRVEGVDVLVCDLLAKADALRPMVRRIDPDRSMWRDISRRPGGFLVGTDMSPSVGLQGALIRWVLVQGVEDLPLAILVFDLHRRGRHDRCDRSQATGRQGLLEEAYRETSALGDEPIGEVRQAAAGNQPEADQRRPCAQAPGKGDNQPQPEDVAVAKTISRTSGGQPDAEAEERAGVLGVFELNRAAEERAPGRPASASAARCLVTPIAADRAAMARSRARAEADRSRACGRRPRQCAAAGAPSGSPDASKLPAPSKVSGVASETMRRSLRSAISSR